MLRIVSMVFETAEERALWLRLVDGHGKPVSEADEAVLALRGRSETPASASRVMDVIERHVRMAKLANERMDPEASWKPETVAAEREGWAENLQFQAERALRGE